MKQIKNAAYILSLIACLNYGILSVFEYDPLQHIFVNFPLLLKLIYFMFGISGFINLLKEK